MRKVLLKVEDKEEEKDKEQDSQGVLKRTRRRGEKEKKE